MGEYKTVTYKAICWVPNGNKRYDIWTGKYIEDKDPKIITGEVEYYIDNNVSNYMYKLIQLIRQLQQEDGFTHLTIFSSEGYIKHCFRISKVEKITWEDVINNILNNPNYYFSA